MDYSKLSDFEINCAVFEALHNGSPDFKEGDSGEMVLVSFEVDVIGGEVVEVEAERGRFNPCNNPADAWPIIVGNHISIKAVDEEQWLACGLDCWKYSPYMHTNPLRAAMIVFLMMQEGKHD